MSSDILVDGAWLESHSDDPDLVLVDARPAAAFWKGHLAGARHYDPRLFSYNDTTPSGVKAFVAQSEWIFSALGVTADARVVFYEDRSDIGVVRAAWQLEFLGHRRVAILDGGLAALRQPVLVTNAASFAPSRFKATPTTALAGVDDVLGSLEREQVRILDTRRASEYFSEEVRAKRGGIIPGALHLDYAFATDAAGHFKPADELRAAYAALGIKPQDEVIAYCGGGSRAAHSYYALRIAGFPNARVYLGSWGEWGNRDDLPVETPRRDDAPAQAAPAGATR